VVGECGVGIVVVLRSLIVGLLYRAIRIGLHRAGLLEVVKEEDFVARRNRRCGIRPVSVTLGQPSRRRLAGAILAGVEPFGIRGHKWPFISGLDGITKRQK